MGEELIHETRESAATDGSVTLSLDALKRAISAGFNHNRDIDCHENSFDQLMSDIMHCVRKAAVRVPANAWQSIETAPSNGELVIAFYPSFQKPVTLRGADGDWWRSMGGPTHWMPLPLPPDDDATAIRSLAPGGKDG